LNRGDGPGEELFFLAMAQWQRGNKKEARRWYGQAVDWTQNHRPGDPELRRFSAETKELVGTK